MNYGREEIDLDFRGPFIFQRHVRTTSPYPTALYRFTSKAYTRDNRYYAGNSVLLACDGRYIIDNSTFGRLWVGHLYGKTYNGPIVRNPDHGASCGGGGEDYTRLISAEFYDPYNPAPLSGGDGCSGPSGGSAGQDEWDGQDAGAGTGTRFSPGDFTNGETVDWATGKGNGGSSVCGEAAAVEYVCIDVWDGDSWEKFSCGYATVC